MIRRSVTRVLLSLLLLLSQQMAIAHAVSHWHGRVSPVAQSQQTDERKLSNAFALDQSCSDCLAFAQIAGAVGSDPCRFVPRDIGSQSVSSWISRAACARTVCVFQSRAPPVAA